MIYQSVSMGATIGKIIRDTKVLDMAYISDMKEWIGEAMDMLCTQKTTEGFIEDVMIKFHKAKIPKGTVWIDAVEYNGRRLPMGNSVKNIRRPNVHEHHRRNFNSIEQTWTSEVFKYPAPGNQTYLYFSTLRKAMDRSFHDHHYYEIEMGSILTDFPEGHITLYSRRIEVDNQGLPTIPDNANYQEALYWYVRSKMIGAGFDDRVFKVMDCEQRFEKFAARALDEITYPSPNEMEHRVNTFRRLINFGEEYFDHYFRVDRPEPMYDPLGPFPGSPHLGSSDAFFI